LTNGNIIWNHLSELLKHVKPVIMDGVYYRLDDDHLRFKFMQIKIQIDDKHMQD